MTLTSSEINLTNLQNCILYLECPPSSRLVQSEWVVSSNEPVPKRQSTREEGTKRRRRGRGVETERCVLLTGCEKREPTRSRIKNAHGRHLCYFVDEDGNRFWNADKDRTNNPGAQYTREVYTVVGVKSCATLRERGKQIVWDKQRVTDQRPRMPVPLTIPPSPI